MCPLDVGCVGCDLKQLNPGDTFSHIALLDRGGSIAEQKSLLSTKNECTLPAVASQRLSMKEKDPEEMGKENRGGEGG